MTNLHAVDNDGIAKDGKLNYDDQLSDDSALTDDNFSDSPLSTTVSIPCMHAQKTRRHKRKLIVIEETSCTSMKKRPSQASLNYKFLLHQTTSGEQLSDDHITV